MSDWNTNGISRSRVADAVAIASGAVVLLPTNFLQKTFLPNLLVASNDPPGTH